MTVVLVVVMFGLVAALVVLVRAGRRVDSWPECDMFEEECRALEATRKRCQP